MHGVIKRPFKLCHALLEFEKCRGLGYQEKKLVFIGVEALICYKKPNNCYKKPNLYRLIVIKSRITVM